MNAQWPDRPVSERAYALYRAADADAARLMRVLARRATEHTRGSLLSPTGRRDGVWAWVINTQP